MTGVVFVFVREDASEAETLAEAFDDAGFSITGSDADATALTVIVWSRHAARSAAFRQAAESALRAGRAAVVSLSAAPPGRNLNGAPLIDLSGWDGEDGAALDPLFEAVDALSRPVCSNVIELPFRPAYEDAEFVELAPRLTDADRLRRAWEAPIPSQMLRPVHEAAPEKLGAPSPRRDFRRITEVHPRAYAGFAVILFALAGGALALNFAPRPAPAITAEPASLPGAVSLTSATVEAIGLEDAIPPEPAPQLGRAGLEPGSARPASRTLRPPRRPSRERAVYRPPAPLPDDILAELARREQSAPPAG